MARKKKNRKKKKRSLKKANMSDDALVSAARKAEAAGNYVSAYNKYSKLIKKDVEKYKEAYLNSCRNCFKSHLNKGAYNKAEEIIKSIRSFSPSEAYSTRLILELNTNRVDEAVGTATKYLCEYYNSMELRDSDTVSLCIDTLVISFLKPKEIKDHISGLYDDIVSVQEGLQRVSKEDYNGARDYIKGINYSSPLSGWKMLIKGMISYYQFDNNTAQKAFSRVKGSCILKEAAESYLALYSVKDTVNREYKNDVILSNICDLLNYEDAADAFPRAQYLFLSGRERDSYKHYIVSVQKAF